MDELKQIVEMIANLPQMALWVIAGFWAYKVIIIGSIYGVIRLAINKAHDWAVAPRHEYKEVRPMVDKITISGTVDELMSELQRLKGVGSYIHSSDVAWLRAAISEKFESEGKKK